MLQRKMSLILRLNGRVPRAKTLCNVRNVLQACQLSFVDGHETRSEQEKYDLLCDDSENDAVILYFHGGGFMYRSYYIVLIHLGSPTPNLIGGLRSKWLANKSVASYQSGSKGYELQLTRVDTGFVLDLDTPCNLSIRSSRTIISLIPPQMPVTNQSPHQR